MPRTDTSARKPLTDLQHDATTPLRRTGPGQGEGEERGNALRKYL